MSHKLAFFNSMINRMIKLPLQKAAIDKELSILQYIAFRNNFNPEIVTHLYKKQITPNEDQTHKDIHLAKEDRIHSKFKYTPTTYFSKISNKINELFKNTRNKFASHTNTI